jgi:putative transposase
LIAIEPIEKTILDLPISIERNMLITENFIQSLVNRMKLKHHHIHSLYGKSIIERTIQYIKDRTESFDDYFPCRKERCMLQHVRNWLNLFTDMHNKMLIGKEVLK